jgi:hypothetical protein
MGVGSRIDQDDYAAAINELAARLGYQIDFAQSALKSLLFVNGGAILALLTMIGNASATFDSRAIWWSFFWYSSGLVVVLLAYFGAFISQFFFMDVTTKEAWNAQLRRDGLPTKYDLLSPQRWGNFAFLMAACCATLALGCFVIGSFVALGGIL